MGAKGVAPVTALLAFRPERAGPDVFTFGEPLAVLIAEPGVPLDAATRFVRTVAGTEINVAVGLARAGHRVAYATRVGADAFGDVVLRVLRGEGVDTAGVRVDVAAPTGLLVRDAHAERAVQVLYYRAGSAASRHAPADLDMAALGAARAVYASGITPLLSRTCAEVTTIALEHARSTGTTVVFDPNLRRRLLAGREPAQLRTWSRSADIVLTGLDEGEAVTGASGVQGVAGVFLADGARLVVVKQGRQGAWAGDGSQSWELRAERTTVLDPVGAGDAFNAGFVSALLEGQDVPAALRRGAALGRLAVQVVGDIEGLPAARAMAGLHAGPDVVR